jgi:hypothetical protein
MRVGIRVIFSDITQSGRPEKRVGHRVADDVRVRMADKSARMLDLESPQNQWPSLTQPMRVVPDPNPHVEAPSSARV